MTILSEIDPWDTVAEGYHSAAKHLFEAYALAALDLLAIQPGQRVADIACGPGILTTLLAMRRAKVSAVDFSPRMLAILDAEVAASGLSGVSIHTADAQSLPFGDTSFDAAFSLFGLMFFPNRAKGYAEMFRTLRPGGTACVSSWSRLSDSPLFEIMAQVLRRLDPKRAAPEYDITSLENPDVLRSEMTAAGFRQVVVHRVERRFAFASASQLWADLTAGSAPIAVMKSRLPDDVWEGISAAAIDALCEMAPPFPTEFGATAWMAIGRKPDPSSREGS